MNRLSYFSPSQIDFVYVGNETLYSVSTILTIERAERDKDSSEQQFKHIQSNHREDCGERLVTKIFRAQIAPLKFNNDLESPTLLRTATL